MENLKYGILDIQTGNFIEAELTAEEVLDREKQAEEIAIKEAEKEAKAQARASALAKLAAIGLTQEEIDSL